MEKDGVVERKYIAGFSATGALVYHHELRGDKPYQDTGRNTGIQVLPYTIKRSADDKMYVAFNALSFRNMITTQQGENPVRGEFGEKADFFTVVDNIDFLVFKWDRGMSFSNIDSFTLDYLNADLKVDILNSAKETRFLAITAGGRFAGQRSKLTLDSGEVIEISGYDGISKGLQTDYRYGLQYSDQFRNGSRLDLGISSTHTHTNGYFWDEQKVAEAEQYNAANKQKYDNDMNQYRAQKVAYEAQKFDGKVISEESYATLTGNKKPASPKTVSAEQDSIVRKQVYLSPSIEFSKNLRSEGGQPLRVGVGLNANIPLKDTIQGGKVNMDMKNHNRNLINARLFLNF
jgi:hypothetical protein